MSADEGRTVANEDIGRYTGRQYMQHWTENTGDRRNVLPDIERAVDEGRPVPFMTAEGGLAHQMLIIGHHGDGLEVYNPWGITSWISESQFVNGQVGDMKSEDNRTPQGVPSNVFGVLLPQPS